VPSVGGISMRHRIGSSLAVVVLTAAGMFVGVHAAEAAATCKPFALAPTYGPDGSVGSFTGHGGATCTVATYMRVDVELTRDGSSKNLGARVCDASRSCDADARSDDVDGDQQWCTTTTVVAIVTQAGGPTSTVRSQPVCETTPH
jgi:hypothetical protein